MIHRSPPLKPRRRPRGFLVMDMMIGTGMALAILLALTAAFIHQTRAERKLSAIRTAARQAESILLSFQSGSPPPAQARIEKLPNPAPAGYAWIRLSLAASGDGPAQSLVGLAATQTVSQVSPDGGARP